MKELFDTISNKSAKLITKQYSTSFSISVSLLAPSIRQAIYNIYGFVRVADEIVDSFEGYPKEELLNRFEEEYVYARANGISSNPIINAFINTVTQYNIQPTLVDAFLKSMRVDLTKEVYQNEQEINEYIYGSADVVGLMCLMVFVKGDPVEYEKLKPAAMKLGSAFQKVNFLRDLKQDYEVLNRSYFPNISIQQFTKEQKNHLVAEIKADFKLAYSGIKQLPKEARFGVFVAYKYYLELLKKIDSVPATKLKERRISVSTSTKTYLLLQSYVRYQFSLL